MELAVAMRSRIFLVMAVAAALGIASPLPQPTPSGATVLPRRLAPLPLDLGHNATRTLAERQSAPASTTVPPAGATGPTESNPIYNNNFFGAGIPSTMLIYVAAAISGGLVLALLVARYFFIKRHYPPTARAYFIPIKGIHIPFLGVHIDGPPARPPRESPPNYFAAANLRRRRRDRTTRGEGIGEGGVRIGERDEDDAYEGDGGAHETGNDLPMYVMETGLPAYNHVDGESGERDGNPLPPTTSAGAASAVSHVDVVDTTLSTRPSDDEDALPSVQDYENATRQARLAPSGALAGYPPRPTTIRAASSFAPASTAAAPSTSNAEERDEDGDRSSTFTGSSGRTKVDDLKRSGEPDHEEEGKDVGEETMLEHATSDRQVVAVAEREMGTVEGSGRETSPQD